MYIVISMKLRYWLSLSMAMLIMISISWVSATRVSKEEFMSQYQQALITNFPRQVTNRSSLTQWCQAILTPSQSDDEIQWSLYQWSYTAPSQSVFIYMMCNQAYPDTYKSFDKTLISSIKQSKYSSLIADFDTKACDFNDRRNTLSKCDTIQLSSDIITILLNDMINIRLAGAWWYTSTNPEDVGYLFTQHFSYAKWDTISKRIWSINSTLCQSTQVPYLGETRSQWCGFPATYNYLISNRNLYGSDLIQNTILLNWLQLINYSCKDVLDPQNIIACGINDHLSTLAFGSMIYNELRAYNQYVDYYQYLANTNRNLVSTSLAWIDDQQYRNILWLLTTKINNSKQLISDSTSQNLNLVSQFESYYPIHIWYMMAIEITNHIIPAWQSYMQNNIYNINTRINTQVPSTSVSSAS